MRSAGIHRDEHGIPHVVGGTVLEVGHLQGVAVARDRCWQLELSRLEATGTTAAVLGARGLPWDRFARRVQLEALARRAFDGLGEESAAFVAAFADGVNQGLAEATDVPELVELGTEARPWQPWTPLAVFAARHVLFSTFPAKLRRHQVTRVLGPDPAGLLHHEGLWGAGSNSWVVGGERTVSGLPMIGGDPHRSFESPNCYQQVRLTCLDPEDRFAVAGFTFPGVPGVQHFAHAGEVAWGITNAMADYQDVFVERLERRDGEVLAEGGQGWEATTVHVERIEVRGAPAEEVEVVVTDRGPVFHGGPGAEESLSLRTPSHALADLGFDSLLPLLRARTAADVLSAFGHWVEPVNNLVVADVHGDVRQQVVGRVPLRPEENRWRPVPATGPGWDGWVRSLPGRRVAPDEHLVTANHRMAGFESIGVDFAPPGRASRIDALLDGRDGLTVEHFASIHRDVLAGRPAVLADAVAALARLSAQGAELQREIAAWDRRMDAGSVTAAAYVAVRDELVRRVAALPLFAGLSGPCPYGALFEPWFQLSTDLWLGLANLLGDHGRRVVAGVDEALAAAVEAVAVDRPGEWGPRHRYRPLHALGHRLDDEPPLAGDNDCVRCTGAVPGAEVAHRGSVARYAWDLAGTDRSGWVVPLGASGDPRSPHHHDQTDAWVAGRLLALGDSGGIGARGQR